LPRLENGPGPPRRRRRWRRWPKKGRSLGLPRVRRRGSGYGSGYGGEARPYATIALVSASAALWVVFHARPSLFGEMTIIGPLDGYWWKLFTSLFAYGPGSGLYAFVTLVAIALFGTLLERRHGPLVVLALFLGLGAAGALAASAVYPVAIVSGGNAGALALLAAWAVPDLREARAAGDYDGDLLAVAAIAALLLAMPFAGTGASWLATVIAGALGLLFGLGLDGSEHAEG